MLPVEQVLALQSWPVLKRVLREFREQEVFRLFDEMMARMAERNAHFTEEEVSADVREATREVCEGRA